MSSGDATTSASRTDADASATARKSYGPAGSAVELEVGASVGRYLVLGRLGAGAMGTVYRAYDPELQREVALKQIRSDALDEAAGPRLIREARAMARLAHQNVVTVHDVVVSDGRVTLAMELVQGGTLADWLDEPREPDAIVAAFVAAGRGLAAAHEADLVHRDFKPGNVLVAADGSIKVTDFGLVKPMHGAEPTASGDSSADSKPRPVDEDLTGHTSFIGTPRYMAPEQAWGAPADPRCDQYALCVALWQALAGRPPFQGEDLAELQRAKLRGPPPWPRDPDVSASVRRAIERGLAATADQRWPDMPALLHALQPRRGGPWWGWALGATAVVGVLSFAVVGDEPAPCDEVATAVDSAWSESVRAELAGTFAASRAPYAAEAWARLETDLTEYGRRWRDLRRQACVATHVERTQSTADMDLQVGCLQQARSSLSAMVDVLRAGDDVVLARAHALSADLPDLERCGDVRDLARSSAPARTLSVEDSQLLEQLRDELARVGALNTAGRYRDAVAVAAQLWAKSDRLAGHPVAAQIGMSYGEAQCESGAVEEGLSTLREAFRRALAADADVVAARVALKLAFYLDDQAGRAHEALWLVDFADAIASRTDGGEQLGARVLSVRAQVYRALGRWDDALVDAEAALQQRIDALGPEHPDVAVSRNNLGLLLYDLDRPAQGVEHLEAASSIWRAQLGENHPEVAKARNNLAMVLERTGRLDEAEREYRASLNIRESVFGAQHPEAIAVRHNLGLVMLSRDEPAAAEELIAQAVEQWETQTPDDQRTRAIAYNSLGLARAALEKKEEALAAFERSVELAESSYGPQHPQICQFWNNLARNLADADPDRARELAERSLATCEPQLGAEHRSVRSARELLEALP